MMSHQIVSHRVKCQATVPTTCSWKVFFELT